MASSLLHRGGIFAPAAARRFAAAPPKFWLGLVLQRNPVVLPDPTPEEAAYAEYEMQMATQKAKAFNPSFFYKKSDAKSIEQQQQAQQAQEQELYQAGDRVTEADRTNDRRSLQRKLSRTLYLVTRDKQSSRWEFPRIPAPSDHLLNAACSTHLTAVMGSDRTRVFVPGYFPQAVLEQPKEPSTFFFCAQLLNGAVSMERRPDVADYMWLDREEALELFEAHYKNAVAPILFA